MPTDPTTAGAMLVNSRSGSGLMIRPGTRASRLAIRPYWAGRSTTSSWKEAFGAARIQPSSWVGSSLVIRPSLVAVTSGWVRRSGRTPATYAVDGTCSGAPPASSSSARCGVLDTTASRSPGRSPGLITLGDQTIFHPDPVWRRLKDPLYSQGAPSWPRSTEARNAALAVFPCWLIGPMATKKAAASSRR